jgi:hypothetical protein
MGTEAGWDAGCFAACLISAALIASGVPLSIVLLLALPGVAGSVLTLWHLHRPIELRSSVLAEVQLR